MGDLDGLQRVGIFYYDASKIHPKLISRLRQIHEFFDETVLRETLIPVAMSDYVVSLRLLDWLITNYSKKHRVFVTPLDGVPISIFNSYKDNLKFYRRKCFDPFKRRERIFFKDFNGETMSTTVAQLNLFKWALPNAVIDFAKENGQLIEDDMVKTLSASRKKRMDARKNNHPIKRSSLVKNGGIKCCIYESNFQIMFDE
jgi:hypothetical protein